MSQSLPLRANLEWLKKQAKTRLGAIRADRPLAKLSEAQRAVAQDYGFASWRKLKAHVEKLRDTLQELVPDAARHAAEAAAIPPDDAELAKLLSAVYAGDTQAVAQLIGQRPALAAARGPDGQTPLHVAAQCNDPQLGVLLLAYGADPDATYGQSGHTALSWAITCNAIAFAQALVRLGHKPDLFCAAGMGSLEHVRGHFDESGTLRPNAARTGSSRLGLDGSRLPCPPASPREQISDALCIACRNGQEEVARFLLTKQPDLSFKAYMGGTSLHWAYFGGARTVIGLLEQAGCNPQARDDVLHCTPRAFGICVPANWGFAHLVRQRLADDPSLANIMDGRTSPLHETARAGHAEIVQLLLDARADPMLLDGDGKTPRDLAAERGHAPIVDMLQRASWPGSGGTV